MNSQTGEPIPASLDSEFTRRRLLGSAGALGFILLSGCGGGSGSSTNDPVPTITPTPTWTPTPTPTSTTAANFGNTGWDSPGYVASAAVPEIADFVAIGAATYTFHDANTSTGVAETVALTPYLISKYLITNANWKAYCLATGTSGYSRYWTSAGTYPAGKENHPVFFLSATQAESFAGWLSTVIAGYTFRLPSEAEWEYAALGANTSFSYPWGASAGSTYSGGVLSARFNYNGYCTAYLLTGSGIATLSYYDDTVVTQLARGGALTNDTAPLASVVSLSSPGSVTGWQYDSSANSSYADFANSDQYEALVNVSGGYSTPVGQFAAGTSWCGLFDMAGNAFEWTSSTALATNGAETGQSVRNIRGGSWYANVNSCRSTYRGEGRSPNGGYHSVGFRLAATKL